MFAESEETENELKDSRSNSSTTDEETASLANVDSYIELLYEEIPEKVRASGLVLQLARDTGNLNVLRKNGIKNILSVVKFLVVYYHDNKYL